MHEFLAIVATFIFWAQRYGDSSGRPRTSAACQEYHRRERRRAPGIIKLTASGYAVAPALAPAPIELGFQAGRLRTDM